MNRHFSVEEVQIANEYMKKCLMSLVTGEMQIKTKVRFHLALERMAIIKKSNNNKCRQGYGGKKEPFSFISATNMEISTESPQTTKTRGSP